MCVVFETSGCIHNGSGCIRNACDSKDEEEYARGRDVGCGWVFA